MRVLLMSLLMIPLALGCTGVVEKPSTDADADADTDADVDTEVHADTVEDLVRIHEEVFDQLVLFTISEGDCEYPFPDQYGPEEFTFTSDTYPFPAISGTLTMSVEMIEEGGADVWSMAVSYDRVSAGGALSEGLRPRFDGSGQWTVQIPGRNHTLDLLLSIDGTPQLPVSLEFGITDYPDEGYRFEVTGSIDNIDIGTTATTRNLCPGDG